jgi:hypothetical protein
MYGAFKDNPTRDLWYYGGPAIPFWKEPAAYFKVRVWSDYDSVGRYSEPATWRMGPLSFSDSP